jgi:hypothetical protein
MDGLRKHVFESLTPARIVALTGLGTEREFVVCDDLVKWFFSYFDFPKLRSEEALRDGIARGVAATFGFVAPARVEDGTLVPARRASVWFGDPLAPDMVELSADAFVLAPEFARRLRGDEEQGPELETGAGAAGDKGATADAAAGAGGGGGQEAVGPTRYSLRAAVNAPQFFRILPALQNLADRSARFVAKIEVSAEGAGPFDRAWLRNAVEEHFEEAGVEAETKLD